MASRDYEFSPLYQMSQALKSYSDTRNAAEDRQAARDLREQQSQSNEYAMEKQMMDLREQDRKNQIAEQVRRQAIADQFLQQQYAEKQSQLSGLAAQAVSSDMMRYGSVAPGSDTTPPWKPQKIASVVNTSKTTANNRKYKIDANGGVTMESVDPVSPADATYKAALANRYNAEARYFKQGKPSATSSSVSLDKLFDNMRQANDALIKARENGSPEDVARSNNIFEAAQREYFTQKRIAEGRAISPAATVRAPVASPAQSPVQGAKMRVRRKSDGQTGTINAKDFNPGKYERL